MRKFLLFTLSATLLLTACSKNDNSNVIANITVNPALQQAVAGTHRSEKNRARDKYRHPAETLAFLGVQANSTVVEIWPGSGWYSEILGPYLKDNGTFYAASFGDVKEPEYRGRLHRGLIEKFTTAPEIYGTPKVTALNPPHQTLLAPTGSADFVLTFRNVHNWTMKKTDKDVFSAAYRALKPGGVFGVVEHRAKKSMDAVAQAKTGYVAEDYVITLAESVGFTLAEKSEINANPKDKKNYAKGVWTLPPSLRLKEVDKKKYLKIGESDRMTLKFVKPQ